MIDSGANIIDIGGESTRPGSKIISPKKEWQRIANVTKNFKKKFPKILLSIDTRKSLVIKNALENRQEVTMVDDQYRMPTFADDLAKACLLAIERSAYGVYHISSNELLSIYEMAVQIADVFDLDKALIKRISTGELKQTAKRPAKTGFNLQKSQKILNFPLYSFKNRLQVFKNQLVKK